MKHVGATSNAKDVATQDQVGAVSASLTRSAINALATAGTLQPNDVYLISDESRIAVATTTSSYTDYAKLSEVSAGSMTQGQARAYGLNIPGV